MYLSDDGNELIIQNKRYEEPFNPDNKKFKWSKSGASCKVTDITGIIFGGLSSRFWALRK